MAHPLILLRILGAVIGLGLVVHAFLRFRSHRSRRSEFLFSSLLGIALATVAIEPNVVNVIAGMMALRDQQFGRLIALLLLSNLALWVLIISLRSSLLFSRRWISVTSSACGGSRCEPAPAS